MTFEFITDTYQAEAICAVTSFNVCVLRIYLYTHYLSYNFGSESEMFKMKTLFVKSWKEALYPQKSESLKQVRDSHQ